MLYHGRRTFKKEPVFDKKRSRQGGSGDYSCFQVVCHVAFFPYFREYIDHSTASSVYEARLALEEFGSKAHTYSPAYTEQDFPEIMRCSSHITFNSMQQFERFYPMVVAEGSGISCGIRVNPEYSEVETELYNPCAPGTRFGITADLLPDVLPQGIEGFHCHCHCESSSYELERTLEHLEAKFSRCFPQIKWLNLGGGHLMTRKDYDTEHLITLLQGLKARHPHLRIILEPGSAFTWQTGVLTSEVVDIVESRGIKTAILNVSFTCHMPDCLEMPYSLPCVVPKWETKENIFIVSEEIPV